MNNLLLIGDLAFIAMIGVAILIAVVGVVSSIVSIVLAIKYVKFNRRNNSAGLSGGEAARKLLDLNGLQHIRVKVTGSLLFGNSYSHYFKKIRLRRLTYNKQSLTSLAMGAQKTALAVMDKEGDPDMKTRVKMIPLVTFGPLAFIPLVVVGVLIDIFLLNSSGYVAIAACVLGLLFYVASLVLSVLTLKTEKKAQQKAYLLLKQNGMATDEELELMAELFRLYNIQYINDIILSTLELIYRILQIVVKVSGKGRGRYSK